MRTALLLLALYTLAFAEPTETIEITLRTRTRGAITGLVVDHNDHGLVIVHNKTPYVFSWRSLEPGSAYAARKDLLDFQRGGTDNLTAADRFALGKFALNTGRNDLAAIEFQKTRKLDPSYEPRIKSALDEFRARSQKTPTPAKPFTPPRDNDPEPPHESPEDAPRATPSDQAGIVPDLSPDPTDSLPDRYGRVMDAYATFNQEVARVIGKTISTHASDHFLITTDFPRREIPQIIEWCEAMYAALAQEFNKQSGEPVFLAKCPVYAFRSRARFRKFARHFDGYGARGSIGYTRSIEASGHTHVVLLREGKNQADDDRFACTLVHEGTHAFLHRLHSNRLIPHWVNEGLADLMADRVLGDRCNKHKDAELLAICFVRYDWPITDMLTSAAPIPVEQYPLAHSVVHYLYNKDTAAFARLIQLLKSGASLPDALAASYEGLTLEQLEQSWRSAIRDAGIDR